MATMATPDDDSTTPEEEPALKRSKTDEDSCREKSQQQHQETTTANSSNSSNKKVSNDAKRKDDDEVLDDLLATWKGAETEVEKVMALQELINIYGTEVEWLLSTGLEAIHRCSTLDSQLEQLHQQLKSKDDQLKTLQKVKDDHAKTIQSLINAQSTHQATILQQAESVTIRSHLRADLNAAIHQRDEGLALAAEHRRTIDLLQQDLRDLKIKLSRATQEKMKIEREYQSTQRLNLSQANNERVDADYYKRKSTELNNRVQSLQIALSEKDRQLTELRNETTTTTMTGNNNRTGAGGKRSL